MSVVHAIIEAFGNQVLMADATEIPQQTISEWAKRSPPEIPPWRRPAIISAALRKGVALNDEAQAYLQSNTRTPRQREAA